MLYILLFVCSIILTIYSYGFLDFNLTLSTNPLFLHFVAPLQHLIYFDRHASARVYGIITLCMFILYIMVLIYGYKRNLSHFPWKLYLCLVIILTLAYPMLSYDLYNYMFHAKILWLYHANPHVHAPLEYSGDLWLRFMRWVHTPSAYGPVFTAIESPAYLVGLGKFVPVLLLMKVMMAGFFVWCVALIGKVGRELKLSQKNSVLSQLLVGLNPFLLMDSIVNGHNDSVMIALFLSSLLLLLQKRRILSILSLALSVGVKYVTVLTLPIYLFRQPKVKILIATLMLFLPMALSPARFQPWYLTWTLIPAALIDHLWARIWIILASLAGLIYYIPYIYTGFWNDTIWFNSLVIYLPIVLTLLYTLISWYASRRRLHRPGDK